MKAPNEKPSRWRFRPPPRGQTPDQYLLCPAPDGSRCAHGDFCVRAHSMEELKEWGVRFDPNLMLANLGRGAIQSRVEADWKVGAVLPSFAVLAVSPPDAVRSTFKCAPLEWRVAVTAGSLPEALGLLDGGTRPLFRVGELRSALLPAPLVVDAREWTCPNKALVEHSSAAGTPVTFEVTVTFSSDVYGRYRQRLALVFPHHAPMLCWLQAAVAPQTTDQLVEELRCKLTVSDDGWTEDEVTVVPFEPDPCPPDEQERALLATFPAPTDTLAPPEGSQLTAENYATRTSTLLKLEEAARTDLLNNFNATCQLRLVGHFVVPPDTTIHHVRSGELFGRLYTQQELSADTAAGRLIMDNCQRALVSPVTKLAEPDDGKKKVYEVLIVAKAKKEIFLRLPRQMVEDLSLSDGGRLKAAIRFQPSRQASCEMQEGCQLAVTRAPHLLFPNTTQRPVIPWNPASHWRLEDEKLNPRQKEAINAMTAAVPSPLPPVLVLGPYGTGKTYTMAQGVKHILNNSSESRVLICTHSNSAADLYISEYLAGYVKQGLKAARPLRVYYKHRRKGTVPHSVRPFTLPEPDGDEETPFRRPAMDDVMSHRVVVCTLAITKYLTRLELPEDTFSHILVDEAAQALEWEVARTLSLAGPNTRLVLAGDHLQLAPDVYSEVCREHQFQRSLLERLQTLYGPDFPCNISLHDNYRSHADIVQLTSELFYGRRLRSRGHPGRHPVWPPVTFFSARGTAKQANGSTGYCNDEEVYEVADRVAALCENWPADWGECDLSSVCVVSAYAEQVQKIRSELRNRHLAGVAVERLLNVQGKEFRAVFVSTVRTRDSCEDPAGDYRFLSDCKLLNTAVTRARSLLAVVGCPETLCSVGACSRYWEALVLFAASRGGLLGTSESELNSQLDAAELQRLHGLNPLAPTFRPQVAAQPPPPPLPLPLPPQQPQVLLQGMPQQQPLRFVAMPYLSSVAPGYLLGRPLAVARPPLLPLPLPPFPPGPPMRLAATNGSAAWAGAGRRQTSGATCGGNSEAAFDQLSTTDLISLLPLDVNLNQLLEDGRLQHEWATQLAAVRGPVAVQLFHMLINKFRPPGRDGGDGRPGSPSVSPSAGVGTGSPATAAATAAGVTATVNASKVVNGTAPGYGATPSSPVSSSVHTPPDKISVAAAAVCPPASAAALSAVPSPSTSAAPLPVPSPAVAAQLDKMLEERPPPAPARWPPSVPGPTAPSPKTSGIVGENGSSSSSSGLQELRGSPSQVSSQRGDLSLPLYLRGAAPPPPPPPPAADGCSYAAAVRRSLKPPPPPPGFAALPCREHHAHGYSHF